MLGLELAMSLGAGGGLWTPDALGASLLGYWDAERTDKLALSGSSLTTWTDIVGSYAATQAVGAAKPRWDANAFGGVLNLLTRGDEFTTWGLSNTVPTADAGVAPTATKFQDVVDAGAVNHQLASPSINSFVAGQTYTFSIYIRAGSGGRGIRLTFPSAAFSPQGFAHFDPATGAVLSSSTATAGTEIQPDGSVRVWITQAATATSTGGVFVSLTNGTTLAYQGDGTSFNYVGRAQVVQGSTPGQWVATPAGPAYGFGRPGVIFDGSDDELTLASVPFPTGANACEIWALVDQTALVADTTDRRVFSYGGNANATSRQMRRVVATGVNRARIASGDGAVAADVTNSSVDLSGRHVMRGIVRAADIQIDVDGVASLTAPVTSATGTARTRIGANTADSAGGFWQGQIAAVLVTSTLSADQASQLLTYLKSRGGIA